MPNPVINRRLYNRFNEITLDPGYDIIVLGGQSNAYSGTTKDNLIDVYPPKCYQLGHYLTDNNVIIPAVEPIDNYFVRSTGAIGPLCTFVQDYINNGHLKPERDILIVAGALSGAGFSDNRWNKGNDLYENLVDRVNLALTNPGSRIVSIHMQLGERDCDSTAALWVSRFKQFSINFKKDVGIDYSSVPVILGGMPPTWVDANGSRILVNDVCKTVDTYVEYSAYGDPRNPSSLTGMTDTIHYNAVSQRELGHRHYTAYVAAKLNSWTRALALPISDLQGAQISGSDINLFWTEPVNTYPYIESYNIYYRVNGTTPWFLYDNIAEIGLTVTGLTDTVTYDFKVTSVNFLGESLDSNIVTMQAQGSPTFNHAFRYLFENNLDNGVGGVGTSFGVFTYVTDTDPNFGDCYNTAVATSGVLTGVNVGSNTSWSKSVWLKSASVGIGHLMSAEEAIGTALANQANKVRVGSIANIYQITQSSTNAAGWHHAIVTYDHTIDEAKLYVDTVLEGTVTIADLATHQLVIGNKNGHAAGFIGRIKFASFYNHILNEAEILALYNKFII